MLDPQVWDEEGRMIQDIARSGPVSVFFPLNGYLLVLPRLVTLVAMIVPFDYYPLVATIITWAVTAAILASLGLAPSTLRGRALLVIATLLVPSDPEVFGLSLYLLWWSAILLYASYFWYGGRRIAYLRLAAIALGGLSSPAILLVAPMYVARAIRAPRTPEYIWAAAFAVFFALVQAAALILTGSAGGGRLAGFGTLISKFVGAYFVWNLVPVPMGRDLIALSLGLLTVGIIIFALARTTDLRPLFFPLMYLWLGSIALSVGRNDAAIVDPVAAGPRYFFLPFVLEGWILVQIVLVYPGRLIRGLAGVLLVCGAFNALPHLSRTHDDLAWNASIAACAAAPEGPIFQVPIELAGQAASHWVLYVTPRQCRTLARHGIIGLLF
jgi:hypothetical protein